MTQVNPRLGRFVCRVTDHDWWAVAYPPTRRWECHRCRAIVEEAPSALAVEQLQSAPQPQRQEADSELKARQRRRGAGTSHS